MPLHGLFRLPHQPLSASHPSRPLSVNRFTESVHASAPERPPSPAAGGPNVQTRGMKLRRGLEAAVELARVRGGLLEMHVEQCRSLEDQTMAACDDYLSKACDNYLDEHQAWTDMENALKSYVRDGRDYFLMNAILLGHRTVDDFVASMNMRMEPLAYCQTLLEASGHSDSDSAPCVQERFENELQEHTRKLKALLESGATISGFSVVKGIKTGPRLDQACGTAVDMNAYLSAVLDGELIHYKGFLSTSAKWNVASDFCSLDSKDEINAELSLNLRDSSREGLARKRALREMLDAGLLDSRRLMHVFNCDMARGLALSPLLPANAQGEDEVLLAPNHVISPQKIICCENVVIIVSKATHISALAAGIAEMQGDDLSDAPE